MVAARFALTKHSKDESGICFLHQCWKDWWLESATTVRPRWLKAVLLWWSTRILYESLHCTAERWCVEKAIDNYRPLSLLSEKHSQTRQCYRLLVLQLQFGKDKSPPSLIQIRNTEGPIFKQRQICDLNIIEKPLGITTWFRPLDKMALYLLDKNGGWENRLGSLRKVVNLSLQSKIINPK